MTNEINLTFAECRSISHSFNELFLVEHQEPAVILISGNIACVKYFDDAAEEAAPAPVYALVFTDAEPSADTVDNLCDALHIHDADVPLNARFIIKHGETETVFLPLITASLLVDYEAQYDETHEQALYYAYESDLCVYANCNAVGLYDEADNLQIFFVAELKRELEARGINDGL